MSEFNLSEKREEIKKEVLNLFCCKFEPSLKSAKEIIEETDFFDFILRLIEKQDKEFIRLLKEEFNPARKIELNGFQLHRIIDKLAGDKLI